MVVLDGSFGEGGGALLRTAMAMASLTVQPVRVENVRAGTPYAGLNVEDLALLRAFSAMTDAETTGAELGSLQVAYLPTHGARAFRGSVAPDGDGQVSALVAATALAPVLARAGALSHLRLTGETYGRNVLGYDAFENATLPAWKRFGLYCDVELVSAGFGLGSRGVVTLDVEPSALTGQKWTERGPLVGMRAIVTVGNLPIAIAERGVSHLNRLAQSAGLPIDAEMQSVDSESIGAHVTLSAEYEAGIGSHSVAGARGVRIESVCQQAFEGFLDFLRSDATVDAHLADQLLVLAAIAEGETVLKVHRLTQRLLTMVWVIKQFLPIPITVKGSEGKPGTITIRRA